ncbi:MAG: PD40 domain-containing protein, partial [Cyanobacteria bacterium NC_groundwater_1444_Ag_S-0.65um_54_12]|nr:PD40 domain-containing protein [Cyanobacteria bacterium NC_groundwater_1444_Ag_S-0.65um_54_12]
LTTYDLVTTSGRWHRHPVFLPDGTLLYAEANGHEFAHVMELAPASASSSASSRHTSQLFPKSPFGKLATARAGRWIYYTAPRQVDAYHSYYDLYRFDRQTRKTVRLTSGRRVKDLTSSPDGKQIMAVLNRAGRNVLALFDPGGTLLAKWEKEKADYQYAGLSWSPDGRQIVLSVCAEGWRDLYLLDMATGKLAPLWRNAAADINPTWSPDGNWILFSSDRSGVFNIYAWKLASSELFQVTSVLTGAFEPAISHDGKVLAFTSYSARGYDIATMSFEPAAWTATADTTTVSTTVSVPVQNRSGSGRYRSSVAVIGSGLAIPDASSASVGSAQYVDSDQRGNVLRQDSWPTTASDKQPYDAWPSLRPKAWLPNFFFPDESGGGIGLSLYGNDVLLKHSLFATLGCGLRSLRPQYALSYTNDVWDPTIQLNLSDLAANYPLETPKKTGWLFNTWRRELRSSMMVTYPGIPNRLLSNLFVTGQYLTVGISRLDSHDLGTEVPWQMPATGSIAGKTVLPTAELGDLALGDAKALIDPVGAPRLGSTITLNLRYQFADSYRFGYSISPEGGSLLTVDYQKANPLWGSWQVFDRLAIDYRTFIPTWWPHHVLALRATIGSNAGSRDGGFLLGGYSSASPISLVDVRALGNFQVVPLRGYGLRSGDRLVALNSEYRFSLGEFQHGLGILPLFFERWYGIIGYDLGNVWSGPYDANALRQSLAAEARFYFKAFHVPLELRIGIAQGTGPTGTTKTSSFARRPDGRWLLGNLVMPSPELFWQVGTFF